MMQQGDRRHRILAVLSTGRHTHNFIRQAVFKPGMPYRENKDRTWRTMRLLADEGLIWMAGGQAGLQVRDGRRSV